MKTPEQIRMAEMAAVMVAFSEGKAIQFKRLHVEGIQDDHWRPIVDVGLWDYKHFNYRIKPEPREIWVNEYHNGKIAIWGTELLAKAESAASAMGSVKQTAVQFREVVDE